MLIETTRFGTLDLDERVFITFPWGIPGFEHVKRYVLLEHRQGPFQWLQAVDEPGLAFVVCQPEVFGLRYQVPREKVRPIQVEASEDLVVLVMVSFKRDQKRVSPHLRGPMLFNSSLRLGYQWSMDEGEFKKNVRSVEQQ
jgi:flagellar assembly factor FliW